MTFKINQPKIQAPIIEPICFGETAWVARPQLTGRVVGTNGSRFQGHATSLDSCFRHFDGEAMVQPAVVVALRFRIAFTLGETKRGEATCGDFGGVTVTAHFQRLFG